MTIGDFLMIWGGLIILAIQLSRIVHRLDRLIAALTKGSDNGK